MSGAVKYSMSDDMVDDGSWSRATDREYDEGAFEVLTEEAKTIISSVQANECSVLQSTWDSAEHAGVSRYGEVWIVSNSRWTRREPRSLTVV
jgi:hypothetical protein